MNDPIYVEAAEAFADRIERFHGSEAEKAIWAFRTAVCRRPDEEELSVLMSLYENETNWFDVAQALLNCDECICR